MSDRIIAVQNAPKEHLGFFGVILEKEGIPFDYAHAYKDDLPALDAYNRLIILGGPMGVYEADRYPFLRRETSLIHSAFEQHIPVLGICLGAQLMARALGARVYPGGEKELGWGSVRLTPAAREDGVFRKLDKGFEAFHWHGDTFSLPSSAVHLASSRFYENQAFRFGASYALQFHLEVTAPMVEEWVLDLESSEADRIIEATGEQVHGLNTRAETFLKAWLGL